MRGNRIRKEERKRKGNHNQNPAPSLAAAHSLLPFSRPAQPALSSPARAALPLSWAVPTPQRTDPASRGPVRSAQARGPALSPHPGSPASPLSRSQHAPPLTRGPSLPASSSPRRARATESADLAVIPAALPPYPARRDSRSGLFKPPRGPALPFTAAARSPSSARSHSSAAPSRYTPCAAVVPKPRRAPATEIRRRSFVLGPGSPPDSLPRPPFAPASIWSPERRRSTSPPTWPRRFMPLRSSAR